MSSGAPLVGAKHDGRTEIVHLFDAKPTRALDLAEFRQRGDMQPGRSFDKINLRSIAIEEVDPDNVCRQCRCGKVRELLAFACNTGMDREHCFRGLQRLCGEAEDLCHR